MLLFLSANTLAKYRGQTGQSYENYNTHMYNCYGKTFRCVYVSTAPPCNVKAAVHVVVIIKPSRHLLGMYKLTSILGKECICTVHAHIVGVGYTLLPLVYSC